ncbi:MAG: BF3164 family lipoprotein [Capnocytophaga sp.]|nr:BF3164 family lipoprotein [Capnocytophaga sp.]
MRNLFFLGVLFVVVSCKKVSIPDVFLEKIKGKVAVEQEFTGYILGVDGENLFIGHDTGAVLVDHYVADGDTFVFSENLVRRGNGPFDLLMPSFAVSSGYYSFCDFTLNNKTLRLPKDSLDSKVKAFVWEASRLPVEAGRRSSFVKDAYAWIDDNRLICLAAPIGSDNILNVVDIQEEKSYPCSFWFDDDYKGDDKVKQGIYIMYAKITKHPSEDIFVYACGHGEYLEVFELDTDYKPKNRKVILERKPQYESTDGMNYTIKKSDRHNSQGIKSIAVTEKYLYVMSERVEDGSGTYKGYSPNHNDIFQVFDWEGNHIKNIELELPCWDLAWDAANNLLYTITEAGDSNIVMRYQLE